MQTFLVTGMTCEHCVASVTEELSLIEGVQSVEVSLAVGAASTVTVQSATPITVDAARTAIAEAGYEMAQA